MAERACAKVNIANRLGLHARPAMTLVDLASGFKSSIRIARSGGEAVDGKSIMEVLMLAATKGTELEITAEGEDAEKACAALCELVKRGFDED